MFPHELIGKTAIRKSPVVLSRVGNAFSEGPVYDYSYTTSPIQIVACTDSHILFKYIDDGIFKSDKVRILDNRWIDNNWTNFDTLLELANPDFIQMAQELAVSNSEEGEPNG